jgi:hypothetical protein
MHCIGLGDEKGYMASHQGVIWFAWCPRKNGGHLYRHPEVNHMISKVCWKPYGIEPRNNRSPRRVEHCDGPPA